MPLAESRQRAERAYVLREVACLPWSKVAQQLGYRSVGAAQSAVARYAARNPLPNAQEAAAGIIARKRHAISIGMTSLAAAQKNGDHRTVAQLLDALTRADAELAKLYGLGSENVNVNVRVQQTPEQIIEETRDRLIASFNQQKAIES